MADMLERRVIRYICPFCLRGRSKRSSAEAHMDRCLSNPHVRGCKSCIAFAKAVPSVRDDGGEPEGCCHGIDISAGLVRDCSWWGIEP